MTRGRARRPRRCSPGCPRAARCARVRARAGAPLRARRGRHGPRRPARRHAAAVARRRAGLPLLVPLDVRRAGGRPRGVLHPDPGRRRRSTSRRSSAAPSRPASGAVWRTAGVRPGDRVAVFGCGGVGLSACSARSRPAPTRSSRSTSSGEKSSRRRSSARRTAWPGRGAPRPRPTRSSHASGGGVDYAFEATGRPEAARAAFLSTRARGAAVLIGIPRADAVAGAAGAADPADGAARARLDLRLVAAGARLPGAARALPARAAAARPADLAPAARWTTSRRRSS